jgi:hypothetical protein
MDRHRDRVVRLVAWQQPGAVKLVAAMQVAEPGVLRPQSERVAAVEQQAVPGAQDVAEHQAQR